MPCRVPGLRLRCVGVLVEGFSIGFIFVFVLRLVVRALGEGVKRV